MRLLVLSLLAAIAVVPLGAQDVVFRSIVDSVMVDVSVRQGGRPVSNLVAADFEVRDDGLVQEITSVSRETLPIDVTFIVDLSASVQGAVLAALNRSIAQVGQRLGANDRAAVVTFNHQITQVRVLETGGWPSGLALGTPAGLTSLFDAMTVSLIVPPEIGRRRMAIVFTDGLDTTSFVEGTGVVEIARRAATSVFTVALTDGSVRNPERPPHESLFRTLAETTGGAVAVLQRDEDLSRSFEQVFDDFRTSYVLQYSYGGPVKPGWHELAVRVVKAGNFDVRARRGYFSRAK